MIVSKKLILNEKQDTSLSEYTSLKGTPLASKDSVLQRF